MFVRIATVIRLLGFVLGGFFAVSAAILLFVWASFDAGHASNELIQYFASQYQRNLRLGAPPSLHLRPFPVLELHQVSLSEPGKKDVFASADTVVIELQLMPLLLRKTVVQGLALHQPVLHLVRGKNGSWNAADLLADGLGLQDLPWKMDLNSLDLVGGLLDLEDQQFSRQATLADLSLHTGPLRNAHPGAFELRASLNTGADRSQLLHLTGTGRYSLQEQLVTGRMDSLSLNLDGDFQGVKKLRGAIEISDLSWQETGRVLKMSGGRAHLQGLRDETPLEFFAELPSLSREGFGVQGRNWKASLAFRKPKRETRLELGVPKPAATAGGFIADSLHLKLDQHADKQVLALDLGGKLGVDFRHVELSLADLSGKLDAKGYPALREANTSLALRGRALWHDQSADPVSGVLDADLSLGSGKESLRLAADLQQCWPPRGRLNLSSPHLDLDALLMAKEMRGAVAEFLPSFGDSSLNGNLDLAQLRIGGVRMARLQSAWSLDKGKFSAPALSAQLYSGSLTGVLVAETANGRFGFNGSFDKLALDALVRDLGGRQPLSGEFSGSYALNGVLKSGQGLSEALEGAVRWKLLNGALLGVDLGRSLREFRTPIRAGLADSRKPRNGENTPLKTASSRFLFGKGAINVESIDAENDWLSLSGRGQVRLKMRDMDFALNLKLLPGVSRSGFSDLRGLSNKPIPIRLRGDLSRPEVRHEPGASRLRPVSGVGKR